ncbi:MAG: SEL1-like repeat protein [Oscillospiraceae bacterium]|nr:SEL1-like repeat protein [Oscillospiraceae bacterium]
MSCTVVYQQWFKPRAEPDTADLNVRHVHYIATRPGAVYNQGCGFGLWGKLPGDDLIQIQYDLQKAEHDVREASKTHTIYRSFLSVDDKTGQTHGLYHRENWEQLVNAHIGVIAKEMDIKPENFCWLASMHCEKGHPHVHVVFWDNSDNPRPEYIPEQLFEKKMEHIRADFAGEINRDQIREDQKEQRQQIKDMRTALRAMCLEANPEKALSLSKLVKSGWLDGAAQQMAELIRQLPAAGSLKYQYLPPEYKELVNQFIDTCLEQPELSKEAQRYEALTRRISELYANGETTQAANLENAKEKLYKELGNEVMGAIRGLRAEIGDSLLDQLSSQTPLRDTVSEILPTLDSYQKLRSLLPPERIPPERMEQQIPGYRQQLDQVVNEVLSDARIRQQLQGHASEASGEKADGPLASDAPEIDPSPGITDEEWEAYQDACREEVLKIYMQDLPEQSPRAGRSGGQYSSRTHGSSGSKKDNTWWTEEYKEARRFLYGTKELFPDLEKAFPLMQAEASTGNGFAMHDLAKMYLSGLGCDKDQDLAQEWFRKAYDAFVKEEATAERKDYLQYRIGKMHSFGYGVEQDYSQAAAWYRKAADADNPFAAYSLASLYNRGQGVEQDHAKAYELYRVAAEHSKTPNAYAAYELGRMCQDGIGTAPDREASEAWFRQAYNGFLAIEKNMADDKLYYRLGQMNLNGVGTEVDLLQAKHYFEKAAELGNANAYYGLGKLYLRKEFEGRDPNKAVEFFAKAAEQNHQYAQYALGKLFLDGEDVPKNVDLALRWLETAAGSGNEQAEYLLGKTLLKGEDTARDTLRGEALLKKAASKGNSYAQYTLGKAYLKGDLLPQNIPEGIRLLTESANSGNAQSQYTLGNLFLRGETVPKNVGYALRWLEEAVANENEHAEYLLGKTLLKGEDIQRDLPRAEDLLKRSAAQGNSNAKYTLGKAYLRGDPLPRNIPEGMRLLTEAAASGNEYAKDLITNHLRQEAGWTDEAIRTGTAMTLCGVMAVLSRMANQRQAMVSQAAAKKLISRDKSREAKKDERAKQAQSSEWGD